MRDIRTFFRPFFANLGRTHFLPFCTLAHHLRRRRKIFFQTNAQQTFHKQMQSSQISKINHMFHFHPQGIGNFIHPKPNWKSRVLFFNQTRTRTTNTSTIHNFPQTLSRQAISFIDSPRLYLIYIFGMKPNGFRFRFLVFALQFFNNFQGRIFLLIVMRNDLQFRTHGMEVSNPFKSQYRMFSLVPVWQIQKRRRGTGTYFLQ